jgi:hypothetical protein
MTDDDGTLAELTALGSQKTSHLLEEEPHHSFGHIGLGQNWGLDLT